MPDRYIYTRFADQLSGVPGWNYYPTLAGKGLLTPEVILDAAKAEHENREWSAKSGGFTYGPATNWMIYHVDELLELGSIPDPAQLVLELCQNFALQPEIPDLFLGHPAFMRSVFQGNLVTAVRELAQQRLSRFEWLDRYPELDEPERRQLAINIVRRGLQAKDGHEQMAGNFFRYLATHSGLDLRQVTTDLFQLPTLAPVAVLQHAETIRKRHPDGFGEVVVQYAIAMAPTRLRTPDDRKRYDSIALPDLVLLCQRLDYLDREGQAQEEAYRLLAKTAQRVGTPAPVMTQLLGQALGHMTKQNAPEMFRGFLYGLHDASGQRVDSWDSSAAAERLLRTPLGQTLVKRLGEVSWGIGRLESHPGPDGPRLEIRYEHDGQLIRFIIHPKAEKAYRGKKVLYPTSPPRSRRPTFTRGREVGFILALPVLDLPC